jgi:spore germination cell wall hydrolase CwlJ-like protein
MGICMLALASSEAGAQGLPGLNVSQAVKALDVDTSTRAFGTTVAAPAAAMVQNAIASTTNAVANLNGTVFQTQPAQSVTVKMPSAVANEAAWLYRNGWPLYALVGKYATDVQLDEQTTCLATAVYFEARGESLEGQLAVAHVVMNRAASGKYPPSWCETIKQPAQFSFVRNRQFPRVDLASDAWRRAQAIAELAAAQVVPSVGNDVLWYHANYVAPSWGHRLSIVQKIGAHIFYRA